MTKNKRDLIGKCAKRASRLAQVYHLDYEVIDAHLDLASAHEQVGIRRHMNRTTGKLEGCFLPRTARSRSNH